MAAHDQTASNKGWLPFLVLAFVVGGFAFTLAALLGAEGSSSSIGKGDGPRIAVVSLVGVIVDGRPVVEMLEEMRRDDSVDAVLLRIDSPGGAVGPSQEIYEAVLALRDVKPVIVSMGGVAASGGYYVAAAGSHILANPGTLTGSLGVIMQFTDLTELMDWAKVRVEVVKTGDLKDSGASYRPMRPEERGYFQALADEVLVQFQSDVLRGRAAAGVTEGTVGTVADGRVLTGSQALTLGLIDELGGYARAVSVAAELSGVDGEPRTFNPRIGRRWIERFLDEGVQGEVQAALSRVSPLWALWVP